MTYSWRFLDDLTPGYDDYPTGENARLRERDEDEAEREQDEADDEQEDEEEE